MVTKLINKQALPLGSAATSQASVIPTAWSDCSHMWLSGVSTGYEWYCPVSAVLLTGHEQVQGCRSGYCVQQRLTWTYM